MTKEHDQGTNTHQITTACSRARSRQNKLSVKRKLKYLVGRSQHAGVELHETTYMHIAHRKERHTHRASQGR